MSQEKILHLIPAEGWEALLAYSDNTTGREPLVCWGLVEDCTSPTPFRYVVGFSGGDCVDRVDEMDNFIGYVRQGVATPEWALERAARYLETKKVLRERAQVASSESPKEFV